MAAQGGIIFNRGFKFLLLCQNGYITLVKAKGAFPTTISELWTCKKKIYEEYLKANNII